MAEDAYIRRFTGISVMPALQIPAGIWVLASPYLLEFADYGAARVNAAIVGPFVVAFALTRLAVTPGWFWVGWINLILGIWLAVSPFALGVAHQTDLTISFVASGLFIAITAILGQFEKTEIDENFPGKFF